MKIWKSHFREPTGFEADACASWIMLSLTLLLFPSGLQANQTSDRPNIILIMADDLGYETIGANGGTSYATPVLDQLAAGGTRFTQAYAQPLCTPTRVQLMTGLSNARNYLYFGTIDPAARTFAHFFQEAGYATAITGKWQLGRDSALPQTLGFNESCLWQHTRRPPRYANPGLEINGIEKDYNQGEYGPDLVNAYALDFIERKKVGPFLLYYPMILTHSPYQPTPDSADWDAATKGEKQQKSPEHFGAMVEYLDKMVGQVIGRLETLGLRERTLVIFLGDNGTGAGTRSMMGDHEFVGGKGQTTRAGMHVPLIVSGFGVKAAQVCEDLVDTTDFLPTLCEAAGLSLPDEVPWDGRSFWPQLKGSSGQPREWIYSWYSPRQGTKNRLVREFAFNREWKRYADGGFYDLLADPSESTPLPLESLSGEGARAGEALGAVLESYRNARPPALDKVKIPDGNGLSE